MPEQKTVEVLKDGPAQVTSFGLSVTPAAQQAAIANLAVAPAAADYNAILAVLRTFGLIAT